MEFAGLAFDAEDHAGAGACLGSDVVALPQLKEHVTCGCVHMMVDPHLVLGDSRPSSTSFVRLCLRVERIASKPTVDAP